MPAKREEHRVTNDDRNKELLSFSLADAYIETLSISSAELLRSYTEELERLTACADKTSSEHLRKILIDFEFVEKPINIFTHVLLPGRSFEVPPKLTDLDTQRNIASACLKIQEELINPSIRPLFLLTSVTAEVAEAPQTEDLSEEELYLNNGRIQAGLTRLLSSSLLQIQEESEGKAGFSKKYVIKVPLPGNCDPHRITITSDDRGRFEPQIVETLFYPLTEGLRLLFNPGNRFFEKIGFDCQQKSGKITGSHRLYRDKKIDLEIFDIDLIPESIRKNSFSKLSIKEMISALDEFIEILPSLEQKCAEIIGIINPLEDLANKAQEYLIREFFGGFEDIKNRLIFEPAHFGEMTSLTLNEFIAFHDNTGIRIECIVAPITYHEVRPNFLDSKGQTSSLVDQRLQESNYTLLICLESLMAFKTLISQPMQQAAKLPGLGGTGNNGKKAALKSVLSQGTSTPVGLMPEALLKRDLS